MRRAVSTAVSAGYFDQASTALPRLRVRGAGDWLHMTGEIDTGAQPAIVANLAFANALDAEIEDYSRVATLANGQRVPAHAMLLEIEWLGETRLVEGIALPDGDTPTFSRLGSRGGSHALLGRVLFKGCRLVLDYEASTIEVSKRTGDIS
jgi:predicted aspartyl protease